MKIVIFHTIVRAFAEKPMDIFNRPASHFTHNLSLAHDFKSVKKAKQYMKESQLSCLAVFRVVDLTK
jgi:hypothetical protein